MSESPRITVVVPTYRRPELLARCLDALMAQTFSAEAFEIVVVDDGHDDATRDRVETLSRSGPPLRYLRPSAGRGPAVARNAGWRAARGEIVAFTDDDTIPDLLWLERGEAALQAHPPWTALSGRVEVPLTPQRRARPTDHELMTMGLETAEFVTANAFVRRSALQRVAGFDERFTRAWREDSDLQFRLIADGGGIGRCEEAVVLHPVRRERWGIALRQQRNALFEALLFKKHPRLYRERIDAGPPWHYYAIVVLPWVAIAAVALGHLGIASAAGAAALALVVRFAARRLARTTRAPAHIVEMFATSALIPFLSVYWRLRGAWRFKVLFW